MRRREFIALTRWRCCPRIGCSLLTQKKGGRSAYLNLAFARSRWRQCLINSCEGKCKQFGLSLRAKDLRGRTRILLAVQSLN